MFYFWRIIDFVIDGFFQLINLAKKTPEGLEILWRGFCKGPKCIFHVIPRRVSLCYRLQRIFFPAKLSDDDFSRVNNRNGNVSSGCRDWMNENVGEYHWKVISRRHYHEGGWDNHYEIRYYLCFRYRSDAMAFKLGYLK